LRSNVFRTRKANDGYRRNFTIGVDIDEGPLSTRKLSVILHRMLRDGSEFRWSAKEAHAA
jgi:hypothetical protein